ncbi:MAG TPA: S41 family peptidase, partial [Chloroflexota bacterium]
DDALDSPAVTAALEAVRQSGRSQPTRRPAPTITPWRRERGYDQMAEPSLAYRLLALFRLWNAVHYFFPYKELMDRPWEDYLPAFLPRFAAAGDALAYATSVAEAAAWLQDSHAGVQSAVLDRHLGTHVPALQVQWIEGQSVVTRVLPDVLPTSVVAVGDVVVAVDGAPVQVRREHLGRLRAASTPQALAWLVHRRLLAGPEGSQAEIGVRKPGGEEARVTLPRVYPFAAAPFPPSRPVFSVLEEGYGYVDLTQLTVPQVDAAFEAIRQTPAVIFDMRGQSHGVFWLLARRLGTHSVPATRFRIPEPRGPSPDTVGAWTGVQWTLPSRNPWTIVQWTPPSSGWRYTGRVVVLINEAAVSQAEHTCLFLEAASDATFVGSATHGANGNVTEVALPGGMMVRFTGLDVRHADGRQLQRVGILPHLEVHPTIAGIRAGRDEVLEAAVAYLQAGTPRPPG